MNICIPTQRNEGMGSRVYGHFGSAPYFVIYDTETAGIEVVSNSDMNHAHGRCNPIGALSGRSVDILATGGIGAGAVMKLRTMGVKVCRVEAGLTIEDVIRGFEQNTLRELQENEACNHHSCS